MKTTTLRKIEKCNPWPSTWKELLQGLGKTVADDESLPYSSILEICGLRDTIWTTRTEEDYRWVKELAMTYARHVKHLMDPDSVATLDVADRYLAGRASRKEMETAIDTVTPKACSTAYVAFYAIYASSAEAVAGPCAEVAPCAAAYAANAAFNTIAPLSAPLIPSARSCAAAKARTAEVEWQKQEFLRVVG